jgi:hypothetical protein
MLGINLYEMNSEENQLDKTEEMLSKILDKTLDDIDRLKATSATINKTKDEQQQQHINYNIGIYDELIKRFETIKSTNVPINETIQVLEKFITHINELLETRRYSSFAPDIELCNAIFGLKNHITDYKLSMDRQLLTLVEVNKPQPLMKGRRKPEHNYERNELKKNQLIFLFYHLREHGFITRDITGVDLSKAVEMLTGLSPAKFEQGLSQINQIELSREEKDTLKTKLDKLGKELEAFKNKK